MIPLDQLFPNLASGHRVTSPIDPLYNCVAWAAGNSTRWWWPDAPGIGYWPPGVPREETITAFVAAFGTLGYQPVGDPSLEPGVGKVAVFAKAGVPTHACRQLANGKWTSKLGESEDIEHDLDGVAGAIYGSVAVVLRRAVV
jgi:hypothetical protein